MLITPPPNITHHIQKGLVTAAAVFILLLELRQHPPVTPEAPAVRAKKDFPRCAARGSLGFPHTKIVRKKPFADAEPLHAACTPRARRRVYKRKDVWHRAGAGVRSSWVAVKRAAFSVLQAFPAAIQFVGSSSMPAGPLPRHRFGAPPSSGAATAGGSGRRSSVPARVAFRSAGPLVWPAAGGDSCRAREDAGASHGVAARG